MKAFWRNFPTKKVLLLMFLLGNTILAYTFGTTIYIHQRLQRTSFMRLGSTEQPEELIKPHDTILSRTEHFEDIEPHQSHAYGSAIKAKILTSRWINFFPHLKDLVENIPKEDVQSQKITSPRTTIVTIQPPDHTLFVGGSLNATITAIDEEGNRKLYGGDFFIAILRRPTSGTEGVSCQVLDRMNGMYSITCPLPWIGKGVLQVILMHPSESIYQMMKQFISYKEYGVVMNATMINSKNTTEYTNCSLGFPDVEAKMLCNYSNPSHGERRVCLLPPSGECSKIVWQKRGAYDSKLTIWDKKYFDKRHNYMIPILGFNSSIRVEKREEVENSFTQDKNKPVIDPAFATSWHAYGSWTFNTGRKLIPFKYENVAKCVRNKRFYFFGDSTIRKYFARVISLLKLKSYGKNNLVAWSQGRDAESQNLNASFQYRSHGPPLHNPGPEDSRPYISDSLDAIKVGGDGTLITITIGYHFALYGPDPFIERIRIIKKSIIALIQRLPGSKFFIKGLHFHERSIICPSPWLAYRYDTILRHEFCELANDVVFIEYWDSTVILNNKPLHPPKNVTEIMIRMWLLRFC